MDMINLLQGKGPVAAFLNTVGLENTKFFIS